MGRGSIYGKNIGGVFWLLVSIHFRKVEARKGAKELREKGYRARVLTLPGGYGVFRKDK